MKRLISLVGLMLALAQAAVGEEVTSAEATPSVSQRFAPADASETPDFRRHVLPLLGRLGCNGRACHGSFQGQGGFRLSLFGYDHDADHAALTAGDAPRVVPANPGESLFFRKPTAQVEHGGGRRLEIDSWQSRLLLRWITAGAAGVPTEAAEFSRLEVLPAEVRLKQPGDQAQLTVFAHWSDGSREDVTALCRFRTNDEAIATIDETGLVTAVRPGDTHVVAFYDNGVQPVSVLTPIGAAHDELYPAVPTPTKIDELVVAKLRRLGVTPSELCTDAEFLRRVSLDIAGTLPTPAEIVAFLADNSQASNGADKRTRKIDELLSRPTYAAWWTTRLCDYTGNSPQQLNEQPFNGELAARQWYAWLYQRLVENQPYDQIAAGMILASGRLPGESYDDYCREMGRLAADPSGESFASRPTMPHFWMRRNNRKPEDRAQSFAYAFLGVRIQCAQCHKHPFDQWTKRDFDDFASFFRPVTFGVAPDGRQRQKEMQEALSQDGAAKANLKKDLPKLLAEGKLIPWREVFVGPTNEAKPKKNKKGAPEQPSIRTARFLEGEAVALPEQGDPRQALVDWLRRDADRYFARAFVNRVWAGYFHVGIVEPADDLNRANPPSNRPLLDYLTRGFIEHGYDMKWLHREIAGSRTYQLSSRPNDTNRADQRNFSHAVPRRLPAEVAYNAILQSTARTDQLAVLQGNASELATGNPSGPPNAKGRGQANYALTVFGRPLRTTNCDCERSMEPTLLQTLFLRNDGEMLGLIERPDGWLSQMGGEAKARVLTDNLAQLNQRKAERQAELAELSAKLASLDVPAVVVDLDAAAETKDELPPSKEERAAEEKRLRKEAVRQAQESKQLTKRRQQVENELAQIEKQLAKLAPLIAAPPAVTPDTPELIRLAYLRTVSRPPTAAEIERVTQYLADPDNQSTALRDVLWALLNTKEFILNH